jgi:hypothetical protein
MVEVAGSKTAKKYMIMSDVYACMTKKLRSAQEGGKLKCS